MAHAPSFIFDIFLRRELHPYFSNPIRSLLADKTFAPLPLTAISDETPGFLMIPNIPSYLDATINPNLVNVKHKEVRQYEGFLCNLGGCQTAMDYMSTKFSKKAIKNIKAKKRQLETQHNITYKNHYGEIAKDHYDFLFDKFFDLLKKRFDEKRMQNRYLLGWKKYHELAYPMILKKEASLFVIYNNDEPIAMALDFYWEDICFGYIQVFDFEYQKYYMGDVFMMERLEWLLAHSFKVFDFLMGETYYKVKWSNTRYLYHHYLFYKPNSLKAKLKMNLSKTTLQLKQYLRDIGILGKVIRMDRFRYRGMSKKLEGFDWKKA
ncbi:GNAT family N-acetyltransferase [Flagellimonas iocasae]|uniref:GNAT family N-acetyltransferase n=1 Tax=Flagellimonas iocasae TaxID=2055905 RepID=A0ABW4XRP7_9FLAO